MSKILLFCFVLTGLVVHAGPAFEKDWSGLMQDNVSEGQRDGVPLHLVDYQHIKSDPRFVRVIAELKTFDPNALHTKSEKLAFWINAYNIAAVKVVVENNPPKSIRDVGGLMSSVWKKQAIIIGGKSFSLDQIENNKVRPMGDPRIHFAIVCASVSCPDLRAEAYSAELLDAQLDDQAAKFLQNEVKGFRIEGDKKIVSVSSIFKWFKKDFGGEKGVLAFLSRHSGKEMSGYSIHYLPYNWNLNKK